MAEKEGRLISRQQDRIRYLVNFFFINSRLISGVGPHLSFFQSKSNKRSYIGLGDFLFSFSGVIFL